MRTGTDYIESLRRRLIVSESKVLKEKKRYCTDLRRAFQVIDFLIDAKDALQKVEAEKEAEILELKVQKQAEVQKVKAEKEAEILELKVQTEAEVLKGLHKEAEVQKVIKENIRLLSIVNKEEAQLRAMSEHCKLLAFKNTTDATDAVR